MIRRSFAYDNSLIIYQNNPKYLNSFTNSLTNIKLKAVKNSLI